MAELKVGGIKNLKFSIVSTGKVFEGKNGKVLNCITDIVSEHGLNARFTVWNEDVEKIKQGDVILVKDGFVKPSFYPDKFSFDITLGKDGKFKVEGTVWDLQGNQ